MAESKKELQEPLNETEEESERAGLKFNIQKMKIMASSSNTAWQMEKKWKQ